MDAEQFKLLLSAIQGSQAAIRRENFACYLVLFENYYTMKGILDSVQIAQLLCVSIGPDHYNSLAAFLGPEKQVKHLSLNELTNALKKC